MVSRSRKGKNGKRGRNTKPGETDDSMTPNQQSLAENRVSTGNSFCKLTKPANPLLLNGKEIDRFGFLVEGSLRHVSKTKQNDDDRTNEKKTQRREQKWKKMLSNWDRTTRVRRLKLRRRLRKGVPSALRGNVWATLGDVPNQVDFEKKGEYERLVKKASKIGNGEKPSTRHVNNVNDLENRENNTGEVFKDTIERDINRTFPTHQLFYDLPDGAEENNMQVGGLPQNGGSVSTMDLVSNKHCSHNIPSVKNVFVCGNISVSEQSVVDPSSQKGLANTPLNPVVDPEPDLINDKGGQASLRRILRAYSVYDPEVGYCQGMNFLSAMFIMFMAEEEAFWLLVRVMNGPTCHMRGLFGTGMVQAQEVLYVAERVIAQFLPKLSEHFERENIHITMYATNWLLTVYSSTFPFELVTRVWDCFLWEGWKISYRIMLAVLTMAQDKLLSMKFEEMLGYLKELPKELKGDDVIDISFTIPLKRKHIEKYQKEWNERLNNGT